MRTEDQRKLKKGEKITVCLAGATQAEAERSARATESWHGFYRGTVMICIRGRKKLCLLLCADRERPMRGAVITIPLRTIAEILEGWSDRPPDKAPAGTRRPADAPSFKGPRNIVPYREA